MFVSIALFSWPLVVVTLFRTYRAPIAVAAAVIGGYLLLPARGGFDLPLLPEINKTSIPALAALACAGFLLRTGKIRDAAPSWVPRGLWPRCLLLGLIGGSFLTVLTNGDAVYYPGRVLPGLSPYDGFSTVLALLIALLPFFLAYRFLASPRQQGLLLAVLCVAGVCYSLLALYEIRMSPQLNRIVYGYFPHSWTQHVRGDGFRPLVFLNHGLWLAIFFVTSLLAGVGASRVFPGYRIPFLAAAGWIGLTLLLSNSLGALIIAVIMVPIALFLPVRLQLLAATIIGLVVVTYPMLRERGLITGEAMVEWAEGIDPSRAESLEFRLDNENILLAKASERPAFGWGLWGRNRVFNAEGEDISVTDGYWVIIFGVGGWTRYLSEFGLMVLPLCLMFLRRRRADLGPETATLAIILAANLVDLIPNATMTPVTWLVIGALWGRLEWQGRHTSITEKQDAPEAERANPYTRQLTTVNRRQRARP